MPPLHSPSPGGRHLAAAAAPWWLAASVASVLCGILSLLLIGASTAGLLPSGWSFAPSFACGVVGVALGHLARRAAPGSSETALATAGLVLSYGGVLLSVALFAVIALLLDLAGPFPPGN
jgi:hypothetical protein